MAKFEGTSWNNYKKKLEKDYTLGAPPKTLD